MELRYTADIKIVDRKGMELYNINEEGNINDSIVHSPNRLAALLKDFHIVEERADTEEADVYNIPVRYICSTQWDW